MLKKLISMATATLLMAGFVGTPPASATTDITQLSVNVTSAPLPGMPTSNIMINNISLNYQWTVGSVTWSPAVSGSFATNTVYTVRFTLTAANTFVFNNIPTDGFTISGAGATGVTDSSTAIAAGANATSVVIDVTFPDTGAGQQQNNNQQQSIPQGCTSANSRATRSNLTDTSVTIDFATEAAACTQVTTWSVKLGRPGVVVSTTNVLGSTHSISYTGLTPGTTYYVMFNDPGNLYNGQPSEYEPSYVFTTTGTAPSGSSNSAPSVDAIAAAAAAAAKAAAAVVAAKNTLVDTLKAGKPITASDLNAADISVASTKAAERVNAKILALPEAKRADLATLQAIVRTENFVDKVSTPTTQTMVTSHDLIQEGLVTAEYKFKATVIRALINTDPAALSSIEKVQAAVKAALASVQARKDRLAATIAKINGTK